MTPTMAHQGLADDQADHGTQDEPGSAGDDEQYLSHLLQRSGGHAVATPRRRTNDVP